MQDERHRKRCVASRWRTGAVLIAAACVLALRDAAPAGAQPTQGAPGGEATAELASPIGPLAYTPGRGLRLGDTRVTLGGYANVDLTRDEGGPARLGLDDLAVFVIADPTPRFHLFSELEVEDLVEVDDHGRGGTPDHDFIAERLYGDANLTDELTVRVGKFLTPVGRWNVIHAQPLVWTTSRPLATLLPFDSHVTGAMLYGTFFPSAGAVTYSLYGQFVNQLDPVRQPQPADRSAGGRLEFTPGHGASVGASYFAFTDQGDWQHLGGLDTLWQHDPFELMGEFVYEGASASVGDQWGLYLQGVLRVTQRFYLVQRYEHFDQRAPQPEVNLVILGVAYKPTPPMILKAEYLIADHPAVESPPGIKFSFAILF